MLFCYPPEATDDNWVHVCLVETVENIHVLVETGNPIPTWPEIIPEAYREKLRGRRKLRDKLIEYAGALTALNPEEQTKVRAALDAQNKISALLSGTADCDDLDALPASIRRVIQDLFEVGFGLLTDLLTRDAHYVRIYDSLPSRVCPFCGSEFFDAPGRLREALDHYLAESRYPFAGANLRNLVPMGVKCNSGYKRNRDMLRKDDGQRRRALDPYGGEPLAISLQGSQPLGTFDNNSPSWVISILGDQELAETWDAVFQIKERYEKDILIPELKTWFRLFGSWCRSANVDVTSNEDLIDTLRRYRDHLKRCGLEDRSFLRFEVFDILLAECESGSERTIRVMRALANLHR